MTNSNIKVSHLLNIYDMMADNMFKHFPYQSYGFLNFFKSSGISYPSMSSMV